MAHPQASIPLLSGSAGREEPGSGSHAEEQAGHQGTGKKATVLVTCLSLCASTCKSGILLDTTALQLWKACKDFSLQQALDENKQSDVAEEIDITECDTLAVALLDLLPALVSRMSGPQGSQTSSSSSSGSSSMSSSTVGSGSSSTGGMSRGFLGGSSGSSSRNFASREDLHNKGAAVAAAGSAQNIQQPAAHDPFPDALMYTLASAMQVLDKVFTYLDKHNSRYGVTFRTKNLTASLAERLFDGGKLVGYIFSSTLFLLRCLRHVRPSQLTPTAVPDPSGQLQQTACRALCHTASHRMFDAIYILEDTAPVMAKVTTRFFQALGCLACEGLPADDEAAWQLSLIQQDASLLELTEDSPLVLLTCPAMQMLRRRSLTTAIRKKYEDLEDVFDMFKAFHMQLDSDDLLSDQIRPSSRWPMDSSEHSMPDLTGGVPALETSDAYFVPRLKDTSLQDLIALLPKSSTTSRATSRSRKLNHVHASKASIITARILAALLSLQYWDPSLMRSTCLRVKMFKGVPQLTDLEMQDLLLHVAAYTHVLSSQLLQGLKTQHASCATFELMYLGGMLQEGWEEASDARSAFKRECLPCSSLAESLSAVMLQMLRLHQSPDARRVETHTFEENMARWRMQNVRLDTWLGFSGVSVALEAGLRHMGSSEPATSFTRSKALRLVIRDTFFLNRTWICMLHGPLIDGLPPRSLERGAHSPCISLYMSLVKSFLLELGEKTYSHSPSAGIPPVCVLDRVANFLRLDRSLWEGKGMAAGSGLRGFNGSRIEHADSVSQSQAWLRLLLIMLRSWVLISVAVADRETGPNACSVYESSATQAGFVSGFRQDCQIGRSDVLIGAVLEACGCNHVGERRRKGNLKGGHARWERFAFQQLQGRVLPGCSHWGCTNIAGFSEAALPTQLCSGCRRARYCRIACQRAAWVVGEHREVCSVSVLGASVKR